MGGGRPESGELQPAVTGLHDGVRLDSAVREAEGVRGAEPVEQIQAELG
jgi:hypothetical protein